MEWSRRVVARLGGFLGVTSVRLNEGLEVAPVSP
jgi:hypothetical protein